MTNSGNFGLTPEQCKSIGMRFRAAREKKGKHVAEMASIVKVREHYLVAMEEGRFADLPPGLNGRGLVRVYARELKLTVDELGVVGNDTVQTSMPSSQGAYNASAPTQSQSTGGFSHHREGDLVHNEFSMERIASTLPKEPIKISNQLGRSSSSNQSPLQNIREGRKNIALEVQSKKSYTPNFSLPENIEEENTLDILTPDVEAVLGFTSAEKPNEMQAIVSSVPESQPISQILKEAIPENPILEKPIPLPSLPKQEIIAELKPVSHVEYVEQMHSSPEEPAPKSNQFQPVVHSVVEDKQKAEREFNKKAILFGVAALILMGMVGLVFKFFVGGKSDATIVREIQTPPPLKKEEDSLEKTSAEAPSAENDEKSDGVLMAASASVEAKLQDGLTLSGAVVPGEAQGATAVQDTVAAEAIVTVLSPVSLQVILDSEKREPKTFEPGVHNFKFKTKAELLIDDGSKLSLKYGNWDMGVLGMEGRKRKITLHAEDFNATPTAELQQ